MTNVAILKIRNFNYKIFKLIILYGNMNNIFLYIIAFLVIFGLLFLIQDVFWSFWESTIDDKNEEVKKNQDN